MRRLLVLLSVGAMGLTGCSTGDDAVDVDNGGEFRFVVDLRNVLGQLTAAGS